MKQTSHHHRRIRYVDDDTESTRVLLRLRIPSLCIGLVLGVLLSFVTSQFEEVLAHNIQVAYFLPFVVYMADAIGTQTQTIYARDLRSGKAQFHTYLIKESSVGLFFGVLFGIIAACIAYWWLGDRELAASVGFSMFGAGISAPLIALFTTQALKQMHEDPAAYAGPIATVLQDTVSVVIYGIVASSILL